jgi:LysM repeat protein
VCKTDLALFTPFAYHPPLLAGRWWVLLFCFANVVPRGHTYAGLACDGVQAVNSIRPLITISILGIVGLVLYMKINETEPVIPPGAADWDMSGNLDIGSVDVGGTGDLGGIEIGGAPTDSMTATAAPAATSAAPAFNASGSTAPSYAPAPSFSADTRSEAPPAFVPNTAAPVAEPNLEIATSDAVAEVAAASVADTKTADSSKLPPLPALPAMAAGAAALANETLGDSASNSSAPVGDVPSSISESSTTNAASAATQAAIPSGFDTQAPITPTESLEADPKTTAGQASLFAATRLAVQSALDRGELSQALLLLSDWYGDPSLSAAEASEVQDLLSQLAGSVIYSTEHRLEPPYMVQAGEKLEDIAQKHDIPWQLLAKINGIANPDQLQAGQQLKVLRGPFSARIDLSERQMVLMLGRRYAGQFTLEVDPATSIEEGYWAVDQKLLTPGNVGMLNSATTPSEERSILLTNAGAAAGQVTILRGAGASSAGTDSAGRVIQFKGNDVEDVYDILTLGSQVMIRR